MLKYAAKRLRYFYPGTFMGLKKKLLEGQLSYPYEEAEVAGVYFEAEKTLEFMDKQVFEQIGTLPFEGRAYPAIELYDAYLTQLYGDYMQFPPEEKRVSVHLYDSFIVS